MPRREHWGNAYRLDQAAERWRRLEIAAEGG